MEKYPCVRVCVRGSDMAGGSDGGSKEHSCTTSSKNIVWSLCLSVAYTSSEAWLSAMIQAFRVPLSSSLFLNIMVCVCVSVCAGLSTDERGVGWDWNEVWQQKRHNAKLESCPIYRRRQWLILKVGAMRPLVDRRWNIFFTYWNLENKNTSISTIMSFKSLVNVQHVRCGLLSVVMTATNMHIVFFFALMTLN